MRGCLLASDSGIGNSIQSGSCRMPGKEASQEASAFRCAATDLANALRL